MTSAREAAGAPRSPGGGAFASPGAATAPFRRLSRVLRHGAVLPAILFCLLPGRSAAQEPPDSVPPADTAAADSLTAPADSLTAPPDSLAPVPDSLAPVPDSLAALSDSLLAADSLADSLVVQFFPELPDPSRGGWVTGVWEWDREALLGNPALSVAQLLDQIPGTIALRGGDFGTPNIVTAFGGGGGRVRLYIDGFELLPLRAGAPDLAQVGLAGFQHVRVRRSTDGLRVELTSLAVEDSRPYSLVEVGTGDLQTNMLRATFSHPATLGGSLAFTLDRLDTEGTGRTEPGATTGGWLRYSRHLGSRVSLRGELRRISASRPSALYSPAQQGRSDWSVRARANLLPGVNAEVFTGRSSTTAAVDEENPDATAPSFSRGQTGVRLAAEHAFGERLGLWTTGRWASLGGDAWPEQTLEAAAGLNTFLGGIEGDWSREKWLGEDLSLRSLRAWTAPLFGLSVFGETRDGATGVPFRLFDPRDTIPEIPRLAGPPVSFTTERKSTRVGAEFTWRDLSLGAARVELEQDRLPPFGFPMDSSGLVQDGGIRSGIEASARVPLYFDGLYASVSYQVWDKDAPDWRYLPEESWNGQLGYHNTFLPTENFEIWTEVGVEGREPMVVPFMAPEDPGDELPGEGNPEAEVAAPGFLTVPYHQSWYFRLQLRVLAFQLFVLTENFTAERELQDFPERFLPGGRSIYGIKWTLWN